MSEESNLIRSLRKLEGQLGELKEALREEEEFEAQIKPNYHPKYPNLRIDGLFKCCGELHYTPNRFKPSRCPICGKKIILGNWTMFCIANNLPLDEEI